MPRAVQRERREYTKKLVVENSSFIQLSAYYGALRLLSSLFIHFFFFGFCFFVIVVVTICRRFIPFIISSPLTLNNNQLKLILFLLNLTFNAKDVLFKNKNASRNNNNNLRILKNNFDLQK